ncbi:MAG: MBOAT family protein [Clostridia bacterium]|nr:MBOAT family protein [Clostridia bacterium]
MTTYTIIYLILAAAALYYIFPARIRWILLLAFSYAIFASGGKQALLFLLMTTMSTWAGALLIGRIGEKSKAYLKANKDTLGRDEKKRLKEAAKGRQRVLFWLTLAFNFGLLAVLKYVPDLPGKAIGAAYGLLGRSGVPSVRLFVPLGISFYTFQSMGYLIDIYHGKYAPERNPFKFALFVSFFPQLIQGPISRYDALAPQLTAPNRLQLCNIRDGLILMLWGFFKKKVIADHALPLIDTVFSDHTPYGGAVIVAAVLMYSLQQYADFSGGIDLVTGGAQLMGIRLAANFRRPYFSVSLGDFWRRWHISLGSWMRDYVFYPFALTHPMQKLTKAAKQHVGADIARALPAALGNILVFLLVGLWHGATGNYIAWGLYNGVILAVSALLEPAYKRFNEKHAALTTSRSFYVFRIIRTFVIVNIGWYFDRCLHLSDAFSMLFKTVCKPMPSQLTDGTLLSLGLSGADFAVLAGALVILLFVSVMQERGVRMRQWLMTLSLPKRWLLLYILLFYTMLFFVPNALTGFIYAAF